MGKLYFLIILFCLLVANIRISAQTQCQVYISTDASTTELNCTKPSITLTANASGTGTLTYLWSTTQISGSITVSDSGTYTVTIKSDAGCESSASIHITKDITPPTVSALAFPATICAEGTSTLVGLGAVSYTWQANPSILDPLNAAVVRVSPATSTTYSITGKGANGCTAPGTVTVTVNPSPTASISPSQNFCQNAAQAPVTFTGSNGAAPYTFAYNIDGGATQTITTTGKENSVAVYVPTTELHTFNYNLVSITDVNGCSKNQGGTATIAIVKGTSLTSPKTASVCNNSPLPFTYHATSSDNNGTTFTWERLHNDSITNGPANGTTDISEILISTATQPTVVTYLFKLTTTTCVTIEPVLVTVFPTAVVNPIGTHIYCNGALASGGIPFSSRSAGATFTWTNDNIAVGLSAYGTGNILPFNATNPTRVPITATITVYVKVNQDSCEGTPTSFTIIVLPAPVLTSKKAATICNNKEFAYKASSSDTGRTTFSWTRPVVDSITSAEVTQNSDEIRETLFNTGTQPKIVKYYFTLSSGLNCSTRDSVLVTVNPTPKIQTVSNRTICNGVLVKGGIPFFSSTPGAYFTWTNSNPAIGLPLSGTGNILPFIAQNSTSSSITANITVYVAVNAGTDTCAGTSTTFTITILPAPLLKSLKARSVCNNADFIYKAESSEAGTSFNWTRPIVDSITNLLSSGTTDSINEKLINIGSLPKVVKYYFELSAGMNCVTRDSVLVTVNPTPGILPISAKTYCNGLLTSGISFTSNSPNAAFSWTNSNIAIGLPANGNGNILPFNARNATGNLLTATITVFVKASSDSCLGTSTSFTITVLPAPVLLGSKAETICDNTLFHYVAESSAKETSIGWTRPAVPGVTNKEGKGSDGIINDILDNDTTEPVLVKYFFTLSTSSSCITTDSVIVTVNPTPKIKLIPDTTFCNNTLIQPLSLTSTTKGALLKWTSAPSVGFGTDGTGSIPAFFASNQNNTPLISHIEVRSSIGDVCKGDSGAFTITVYPTAALTSVKDTSVCNNVPFTYTARSSATPTTFSWTRPFVPDITEAEGRGPSATITETLHNTTSKPIIVTYIFTLSTGPRCSTTEMVKVTVNPTPVLDPIADSVFCNGVRVNGINFGTTSPNPSFTWTCDASIGFGSAGSGNIPAFTAVNTGTTPIVAHITVSITASKDNCPGNSVTFTITVNPSPPKPGFTSMSLYPDTVALKLCSGAQNINFNVNSAATGVTYHWTSSVGRSIVAIRDTNDANTVITFPFAGNYKVNLIATNTTGGCANTISQDVQVSATPTGIDKRKILLMQPGNLLIYPNNSMRAYQWGYDSVIRTSVDSSFGVPTAIEGQVYQFFIPGTRFLNSDNSLNQTSYLYWVLLRNGDCYSKVYFNGPYSNNRVIDIAPADTTVQLQILPNPNKGDFQISLKGNIYGSIIAQIYDATGKVVYTKKFQKSIPAIYEKLSTNNLPGGPYFLILHSSDLKKVSARFIIAR